MTCKLWRKMMNHSFARSWERIAPLWRHSDHRNRISGMAASESRSALRSVIVCQNHVVNPSVGDIGPLAPCGLQTTGLSHPALVRLGHKIMPGCGFKRTIKIAQLRRIFVVLSIYTVNTEVSAGNFYERYLVSRSDCHCLCGSWRGDSHPGLLVY